ncbi:minor tail protein [Gordonia phage Fairfaxidum]|uniref:Minor tail protein n=1 Tax=Gordonia phage Fairfaxidum TaxID=2572526 RepID=A0A4D6T6E4_9CAUD|nr:minor tail protein [Gordonia phage Fairfaxidum]QCG77609.1 hypothetical protein SEA_FAIRFAXIDUM_26 [Gordonia phage Fairfaxidum]
MTGPTPAIPEPYALDDPSVLRLGKFLSNAPLSNGQFAPIPDPLSTLVAQAVCNYTRDLVYSGEHGDYVPLGHWESTPDLGDVQVETVAGEVTRMIHRVTGISVLGENPDQAWKMLREKVRATHG